MSAARKTLGYLCAALFVVSGIVALFAINIERRAFNSTSYKQAFESQKLYERMPEILAQALSASLIEDANSDPYLEALSMDEWQAVIASLLPPENIKTLTDDALDSTFDYLNGKTDSVSVSLLTVKRNLAGPAGIETMKLILHAQPDCTAEQLLQMGVGFLGGDIALCNPPAEMMGLIDPLLESQLQIAINAFPNEFILLSSAQTDLPGDPRAKLKQIRTFMKLTPAAPFFFLLCIVFFFTQTLIDRLNWLGYSFTIIGGISFLMALLGSSAPGFIAQEVLQNQGEGFIPPILFSLVRETLNAVMGQILKPITFEGLALASLGVGMILVAVYRAQRNQY